MKTESQIDSKIKELEIYLNHSRKYGLTKEEERYNRESEMIFRKQIKILKWVLE